MKELLLASNNADKAKEFRAAFAGMAITFRTLHEFPGHPPTVEDADTLEGNAVKKAIEAFARTGIPAVGDDTGLEVHYLNGRPGVYSSRYAGPGATYASNCRLLLREMRGVPERRRGARFRCVLAFTTDGRTAHCVEGVCPGTIIEKARGTNGFGYDPVFVPDGYAVTFAEMDIAVKNSLSHRGRAIMALKDHLRGAGW